MARAQGGSATSVSIGGTTSVNITQVGGASFSLGQQLAAASLPVVLTAAQLTTLTPLSSVAATQSGNWTSRIVGNLGATLDAVVGAGTAPTNMLAVGGLYNSTEISPTTGQSAALQLDSKGRLRQVIMDAAGNTRGANVDANNNLGVVLAAETTKVIGTVNVAASQTIAVTNTGTFAVQATPVAQVDTFMLGGVNIKEINAVTPLMGNGGTGTGSLRVTIASDNTAFAVNPVSATVPVSTMNSASANSGINSALAAVFDDASPTAITENSFGFLRMSTNRNLYGTIRDAAGNERGANVDANSNLGVVLAAETSKVLGVTRTADGTGNLLTTNSTTFTAKNALDANLLGTLGTAFTTAGFVDIKGADGNVFVRQTTGSNLNANVTLQTQTDTTMVGGVNIKEINAVTPLMGNGATGTGSQRVTIASDNTAVATWGQGATGAAVPSGAQYAAGIAKTALPTAATDGNLTGLMLDKFGRQIVLPQAPRDLIASQTTTINSSTSETTIISAGAAGIFNDLLSLIFINTSAAATRVDLRDATSGSVIGAFYLPAGDTRGVAWNVPLPQTTAANNWTITCGTSVSDIRILAQYVKNK